MPWRRPALSGTRTTIGLMTEICRIRGHDYELIEDYRVMPEHKPIIRLSVRPRLHPSMREEGADLPLQPKVIEYVFSYFEYDIDERGVTRLSVYLPAGVKPPARGMMKDPGEPGPSLAS